MRINVIIKMQYAKKPYISNFRPPRTEVKLLAKSSLNDNTSDLLSITSLVHSTTIAMQVNKATKR